MLLEIPDEILISILKKLDLHSLVNVSKTCKKLKIILLEKSILSYSCIKKAHSVYGISSEFLNDYGYLIEHLDLSETLTIKAFLLQHLSKVSKLISLNVSYTNVTIPDFALISDHLPHLKHLSIDYRWSKQDVLKSDSFEDEIKLVRSAFQILTSVALTLVHPFHFVSKSPFWILGDGVKKLQISMGQDEIELQQNHFPDILEYTSLQIPEPPRGIKIMSFKSSWPYLININVLTSPFKNAINEFELLFMNLEPKHQIIASPRFYEELVKVNTPPFTTHLYEGEIDPQFQTESIFNVTFWHSSLLENNPGIAKKVVNKLRYYLPVCITSSNCKNVMKNDCLNKIECCISICALSTSSNNERNIVKLAEENQKQFESNNQMLNIDDLLSNKGCTALITTKMCCCDEEPINPVTFGPKFNLLKNLTSFTIYGILLDIQSYEILFKNCEYLETFCVDSTKHIINPFLMIQKLYLSQKLKNFKFNVRSNGLNLDKIFYEFSKCVNIEFICIKDKTTTHLKPFTMLTINRLLANCQNLFLIEVNASTNNSLLKDQRNIFKLAKDEHNRPELRFSWSKHYSQFYNVTPHSEMFFPMKDLYKLNFHEKAF